MTKTAAPGADEEIDNAWTFGQFSRRLQFAHKFVFRRMIDSFSTYQPIMLDGQQVRAGDRETVERWKMIEKALSGSQTKSLLDLGCAEGYFVRMAASRLGCIALGLDGDVRRVFVAQNLATTDRIPNTGFVLGRVDPETIGKLPAFDTVIFCSVLHHVMRERGLDEARAVMTAVRNCTKRTLIFDTGQSNETSYPWSAEIPKMEPDPVTWISNYLTQFGFRDVKVIGETAGYSQAHPRSLFMASV